MPNFMLVAEDNNYPKKGGVAALIGIYPNIFGAENIKSVVKKKFPESNYKIEPTDLPVTVKYPENFMRNSL